MAKFKVLKPIRDKEQDKMLKVGEVVELTVKRVDEAHKRHGEGYFKRINEEAK